MNYWKHSLLSQKKFGGDADDYLTVHKFMDTSKLFYFDIRHRILLHHTYGIDLCIRKFGDMIINSANKKVMIRDIAAEHCREDLCGIVPTLNNWFKYVDPALLEAIQPVKIKNSVLQDFVLQPLLMSGSRASLIITQSNFGVFLVKELLGLEAALELSELVQNSTVNEQLPMVKLTEKWQYRPDTKQLKDIENELV
jgi:hypothetical protein